MNVRAHVNASRRARQHRVRGWALFAAALSGASLAGSVAFAAATDYPARPIRMVVPYPPGGPTDVIVRVASIGLAERLRQPIVVDNRAGASGMIGAELVSRAVPDGYTLLVNPSIHVILPSLIAKMNYDPVKDFTHVTIMASVPLLFVVNPSIPVKNVREFIAYAKSNPGKLNFASSSPGSSSHLAGEQLKALAGVDMQHIPYKGSVPALTDVASGLVQFMFDSTPSSMPFVRGNRVRALAVTTGKRTQAAPEIPTMAEAGLPGFEQTNWYGVWGPRGLPREIVRTLADAIRVTMQRTDIRDRLTELGADPAGELSPAEFERYAIDERARYARVVKQAGIKPE
ncbi:MAG: tripartite tricarboxylate transporter substrate binding protein [Proteobacteria bacterium]|nr:tripartite tricarboxylate transporter substrate binding protein [Burkholderiales bacterium]